MKLHPTTRFCLTIWALIALASCSKLTPFTRETFQTIDGQQAITLISRDELELRTEGTNLICKYKEENGSLRVTANIMGTTQAFYYQRLPQGLRGSDGLLLFSESGLVTERAELQRQQLAKQAAKRAEQQRLDNLRAESRKETRTLARAKVRNNDEPVGEATVTDVSVKIRQMEFGKMIDETHWFGSIQGITDHNPMQIFIVYGNGMRTRWFYSVDEQDGSKLKAALRPAWERWQQKYSGVIRQDPSQ